VPAGVTFPIAVQARTVDGRVERAELAPGQQQLDLVFASTKRPPAAVRRPEPARRSSEPKRSTELAPPPYE
jgi:hypothetical protein